MEELLQKDTSILQLETFSKKAHEADQAGNENEALRWFMKGLHLARKMQDEEQKKELTSKIMTML